MTVEEMIKQLRQYPKKMEVQLTDGYQFNFYKGDFAFQLFEEIGRAHV